MVQPQGGGLPMKTVLIVLALILMAACYTAVSGHGEVPKRDGG